MNVNNNFSIQSISEISNKINSKNVRFKDKPNSNMAYTNEGRNTTVYTSSMNKKS